jgi:hypothetical protein
MADTKISALSAVAAVDGADEAPVNDAGTTKKMSMSQLLTYLKAQGMSRVTRLGTAHTLSSTTGTEVAGLSQTLEAGTYTFQYFLIVQSATATVGPMLGINFTGTHTKLNMHFRFADDSTALTAEVHEMDNQGNKAFGFISGMASAAESSSAPDMGTTVGVSTTGQNILCFIEGVIVVTVSGDLELWHSSETATSTSVMEDSSLIVTRTA